jgi:hypothetical protein
MTGVQVASVALPWGYVGRCHQEVIVDAGGWDLRRLSVGIKLLLGKQGLVP